MHIAIIFINIGSYHAARLQAAYQECQSRGWKITAIQVTDNTLEHPWGNVGDQATIPVKTLLPVSSGKYDTQRDTFSPVAGQVLKQYLDTLKPDAVFLPGWAFTVARAGLQWCRQRKAIPILMSETKEDDSPRVWWRELIKRRILKSYSSALVGGLPHKRYLIKLGKPAEAIFLGYDVVDNESFHPSKLKDLGNPLANPFFLASNRFIPKKNLLFLLDVYAAYHQQAGSHAWHLVLCGDGELRPQLEQKIAQLGLKDVVHLPGFLKQAQLLPYFAHARCFIHASIQEEWGLVVNEAMAAALPVLVSNRCGCFEDLVIEGVNGFGFDPENQAQLMGLMLRLSSPAVNLSEMGCAALNHIQKFSPNYFAQGLVQAVEYATAHP